MPSTVMARDIKMSNLYSKYMRNSSQENLDALQAEITHRSETDKLFAKLFPAHIEAVLAKKTPLPTDFECYRTLVNAFEASCGKFTDYSMKYMRALVAECEGSLSYPAYRQDTIKNFEKECKNESA